MPNRQLVEYVKGQLSVGADDLSIRQVLVEQGWDERDINKAFVTAKSGGSGAQMPKKGLVGVILVVLVLLLGVSLFLVVFSNDPEKSPEPVTPPPIVPPTNQITGLAACKQVTYSMDKHDCYVKIHETADVECRLLDDRIEQGFCSSALEEVLITRYMAERN